MEMTLHSPLNVDLNVPYYPSLGYFSLAWMDQNRERPHGRGAPRRPSRRSAPLRACQSPDLHRSKLSYSAYGGRRCARDLSCRRASWMQPSGMHSSVPTGRRIWSARGHGERLSAKESSLGKFSTKPRGGKHGDGAFEPGVDYNGLHERGSNAAHDCSSSRAMSTCVVQWTKAARSPLTWNKITR